MRAFVISVGLLFAAVSIAEDSPTLYKRVGGYDVIAALSDDFLGRLGADPELAPLFRGVSASTGKVVRQGIVNMICEAAGGPCLYTGKSMAEAHGGLKIDASVWEKTVKHFSGALDAANVGGAEKEELRAFVESLRADIVEVD